LLLRIGLLLLVGLLLRVSLLLRRSLRRAKLLPDRWRSYERQEQARWKRGAKDELVSIHPQSRRRIGGE
jgi:hypothetical protein